MRVFFLDCHICILVQISNTSYNIVCLQATLWVAKGPMRLQAHSKDPHLPALMRGLIRVFFWAHMSYSRKCCAPAQIMYITHKVEMENNQ